MDKTKINKGRMYHSSDLVLEKFFPLFKEQAGLVQAHQSLKNGILMIDGEQRLQVADSKGLTQNKEALRIELTRKMLKFSLALRALATMLKNREMLVRCSFQMTQLNRMADPILVDVGQMLHQEAVRVRGELAAFFLNDEEFQQLESLLKEFKGSIPQKRMATTVSKSSNQKIADVFKSLDILLKREIDVYVAPYQFDHPEFYSEYCNARMIIGYTGRGSGKTVQANLTETNAVAG
jgi:hypothetical protein